MSRLFAVNECKYGVEIISCSDDVSFSELLTAEEAENLAHQLFDAAREHRMNAEDYLGEIIPCPGECGEFIHEEQGACEKCWEEAYNETSK